MHHLGIGQRPTGDVRVSWEKTNVADPHDGRLRKARRVTASSAKGCGEQKQKLGELWSATVHKSTRKLRLASLRLSLLDTRASDARGLASEASAAP